jgi:hypothetical protein
MSYESIKAHVLNKILAAEVEKEPFYSLYIEDILPADFYNEILSKSLYYKTKKDLSSSTLESMPNVKYDISKESDPSMDLLKHVFMDDDVSKAMMNMFYVNVTPELQKKMYVKEYTFSYAKKNRSQRIHTDIPCKLLSFVFYLPEPGITLTEQEERENGTVLYDQSLNPVYKSKFKANSVCVFAPHFYTYHRFDSTIENRNTLNMFFHHKDLFIRSVTTTPDIFKSYVLKKVQACPLLEYQEKNIRQLMNDSKINYNLGAVVKDE